MIFIFHELSVYTLIIYPSVFFHDSEFLSLKE